MIFACGFAQEKSLHDTEDSILLAAAIKRLSFAEEDHVPKPEDMHNNCDSVEEILRELSAERAKNRNLNQTISNILEEMEDMKKNIMRNEEKITENQSSVVLLTSDVEDLQEGVNGVQDDIVSVAADVERNSANITNVLEDVVSLTSSDQLQTIQIESLFSSDQKQAMEIESLTSSDQLQASQIVSLGTFGSWCGHNAGPLLTSGTITYDRLTFSDNNMDTPETPLNINTGIYSHKEGCWVRQEPKESRCLFIHLCLCYANEAS